MSESNHEDVFLRNSRHLSSSTSPYGRKQLTNEDHIPNQYNEPTLINITTIDALSTTNISTLVFPHYPKSIFNFSMDKVLEIFAENERDQKYFDKTTEIWFIVFYSILIIFGVCGNVLIGFVIWRKKTMRTARNIFIINLAVSDLSMCVVSMPFTLIGLLYKEWNFGNVICKLVPVIQATNILVSTGTIVAIAVDRYISIVCEGMSDRKKWQVAGSVALIWISSFLFTLPLYSYYLVHETKLHSVVVYKKCIEQWPSQYIKEAWIVTLLLSQYVFPIIVLGLVHASIKRYLNRHSTVQLGEGRTHRELNRNRKTTILLSTIAISFSVSWLPWHIANLLADFNYEKFNDPNYFYKVFGACHIIAMSSACSNPVLYGWLNTNLRRELLEYFPNCLKVLSKSYQPTRNKHLPRNFPISNAATSTSRAVENVSLYDIKVENKSLENKPVTPPDETVEDVIL